VELINRFFNAPGKSFFLFGPRGTGKSTLIKKRYPEALRIDFLRPEEVRTYLARPERLRERVNGLINQNIIILDEIQRVPSLLSIVHELIEEKRGYQFILTGSSARKLKRTSSDLLGGRALRRELHPFIASELKDAFNLEHALNYGLLPLIFGDVHPQDTLNGYISLYLYEEIQAEGLVRNLEGFSRFLEVISFSHGSLLNVSNVSRECEVKRKTIENYVDILYDLLLAFELKVFTKHAKRELSAHPKFYLFDTGVFRTLRPKGPLDKREEIDGAALEGLIAHHLRAWNDYNETKHDIYFWRTRSGVEVDFVVYGPKYFYAIEVKNSKFVQSSDIKSLETFLFDYPEANALLLYRGNEYLKIKNILCVPVSDFLKQLIPNQAIWPVN
jgi:predicted AAA+ superfamily ATPase